MAGVGSAHEHILAHANGRRSGDELVFKCPRHSNADGIDSHPSFTYNTKKRVGRCLSCSFSGGAIRIASVMGWQGETEFEPLTLEEYSAEKGFTMEFLRALGLKNTRRGIAMPYLDELGQTLAVHTRHRWETGPNGEPRFTWRRGDKIQPYGLWKLDDARRAGWIIITESTSDAHTCWFHQVPAVGVPGAKAWNPEWASCLQDIPEVLVWQEPGDAGQYFARSVCATLSQAKVVFPPGGVEDISEFYLREPEAFRENLETPLEAAVPWHEIEAGEMLSQADADYDLARELLHDPALLYRIGEAIASRGLAGERRNALLVYLALTSRLLPKVINIVVKGPSAGGKSFLLETVCSLIPPEGVFQVTSMSPRVLVYTEECLSHRVLIIAEAHGNTDYNQFLDYLIRSLLSEGRLVYPFVEKTQEGMKVRTVEKQGPTGFITTTTRAALHPEVETRLLTIEVQDSPEQTALVLQSIATRHEGSLVPFDVQPYLALQRWLVSPPAAKKATVPYASALARAIGGRPEVRLRRDFEQLLIAIEACAVLHQCQRERQDDTVIASVGDYAAVWSLMTEAFAETLAEGLTKAQREAVGVVRELNRELAAPVTYTAVADRLGLSVSSASRRLSNPIRLGYVVNEETNRGRGAKLALGTSLPEAESVLPSPEELAGMVELAQPTTQSSLELDNGAGMGVGVGG